MHILRILSIFCLFFNGILLGQNSQKIFLYFDINRTIVALDATQNYSFDDLINLTLAKNTYAKWDTRVEKPISYYDYVYQYVYPGPQADRNLRKIRRNKIHRFVDDLQQINPVMYPKVLHRFQTTQRALSKIQNNPFPSFIKFLEFIQDRIGKDVHLIFRSFGLDFDRVYPSFASFFSCEVVRAAFKQHILYFQDHKFSDPQDWISIFEKYPVMFIQDDFHYWNQHQEHATFGKPMPISEDHKAFFFDDNLTLDGSYARSIVAPIHITTKAMLSGEKLTQNKILNPVNTLDAILEEDYYIRVFQDALDN